MSDMDRLMVCVCTCNRPELLAQLIQAVERNATAVKSWLHVGMVIVDDSLLETARTTVEKFSATFDLGLIYLTTASGNISVARNTALDAGVPLADWLLMTDDDCEPVDNWVELMVNSITTHSVDAVTGPQQLRPQPSSPQWMTEQPFFERTDAFHAGETITTGSTFNFGIRSQWLAEHPHVRFREDLGKLGGEDAVFFNQATGEGMQMVFDASALVYETLTPQRSNYAYLIRSQFWVGNSEGKTNLYLGSASKPRLFARGTKRAAKFAAAPFVHLAKLRAPQFRYNASRVVNACGLITSAFGIEIRHH